MRTQNTIRKSVVFSGKGLHSGKQSVIKVKPAVENTGIVFEYNYHGEQYFIPYRVDNVVDTQNNIAVSNGQVTIKTVEHLVSALYGLRIDNCVIECSNSEIPIMDGSSSEFVKGLLDAGVQSQDILREELRVMNPLWVNLSDKFIVILPYTGLKLNYTISFPDSPIGTQNFDLEFTSEQYIKHLSGARTFGFIEDLNYYQRQGLVLGGGMDNVHVFSKKENRSLNHPRFENEPVRHKVLDLIGAVALLPFDINGFIISYKGGHTLDVLFAQKLSGILSDMSKKEHVYQYGTDINYYYSIADFLEMEKFPS